MPRKFHGSGESSFGCSENNRVFFVFFFFFYMYMILWSKRNTCSFVNTMPKYIHSNINPIYTYTNTGIINMYMYRHTEIDTYIYLFSKMKWMKKKEPLPATFTITPNLYPTLPPFVGLYKVDFIFSLFLIKF